MVIRSEMLRRADAKVEMKIDVGDALDVLDDREKLVVKLRYGVGGEDGPTTFEQIGKELGVTYQRVEQIEAKAFYKLKMRRGSLKGWVGKDGRQAELWWRRLMEGNGKKLVRTICTSPAIRDHPRCPRVDFRRSRSWCS